MVCICIIKKNYNKDYTIILNSYKDIFNFYFPFLGKKEKLKTKINLICHALARAQDYCVIKKFSSLKKPITES